MNIENINKGFLKRMFVIISSTYSFKIKLKPDIKNLDQGSDKAK